MIEYRITVDDPVTYTAPFTVRAIWTMQPGYEVYEYSCHEGNFAVGGGLAGERAYERDVEEAKREGSADSAPRDDGRDLRCAVGRRRGLRRQQRRMILRSAKLAADASRLSAWMQKTEFGTSPLLRFSL